MANLKESLTKGITALNVKTNNFMEENKCKTYITTLEGEIKELKLMIGESVYAKWNAGTDISEGVEELGVKIKEKYNEISAQQQKILQLQEEEKQILGASSPTVTAPEPTGEVIYCSQCGTQNSANYKFCCKCGTPLK